MNAQLANWGSSLLPFGSELLWTALPWMLLYGVLGFVLAIIICYQLAKKCLLVRHPRAWHVAAKLSYVLILVALPLLGGAFGAVHSVHRLVNQALVRDLQPVFEAHAPVLRIYRKRPTNPPVTPTPSSAKSRFSFQGTSWQIHEHLQRSGVTGWRTGAAAVCQRTSMPRKITCR